MPIARAFLNGIPLYGLCMSNESNHSTPRINKRVLPTVSSDSVVDCSGCGVCCMHMGYPVYTQATETRPAEPWWETMPEAIKQELLETMATYQTPDGELDGPCIWLDMETRRCRHHEHRPNVCRDFQVGSKTCRDWRNHYRDRLKGQ
ncbi:Flagellin N-methylase [Planctomycetes bacterium CA13]|uniref:Flagellin N-methylase n=1 Tax=Novipirellula herctigrandis TaxID=2527986 RepID=A0A5C5Z1B3_9BACT|nr:Flagellin N-methylase [Planctomycetes bacterium CA13]